MEKDVIDLKDGKDSRAGARKGGPSRAGMVGLALGLALLVAALHWGSGSRSSELGAHPDEAAHFVTGLMVRDYLASGFHEAPLRYADEYYRHYPKIGLGNWPPIFYLVQAAWTLVFPVHTVLWLMAVLGLALALVTARWLWREFGWAEAVAGGAILTGLPLVQQYSNMVMAEVLSALLMFAAAGFFARYLEGEEWRGAAGFGICAGLAIMTKGTGLALVFVPALAIMFTGHYEVLRRGSLWAAAALAAVIGGPWTWHFRDVARAGWLEAKPSLHFTKAAVGFYGWEIYVALGGLLTVLALAGAVSLFLPKTRKPAISVCSLALVLAVWGFQCLAPVGLEARHLTPAMPALMVLAMTALRAIQERRARLVCVSAVVAVFFGWPAVFHPPMPAPGYGSIGQRIAVSPFRIPRRQWGGFEPVAEAAMAGGTNARILIASDSRGEGMFIADIAARDPHRPGFTVERASKVLASSTWSGSGYQSLYRTPEEVRAALAKAGIGLVVTDASLASLPEHDRLLMEAVAGGGFARMQESAAERDGKAWPGAIVLYGTAGR